MVGGKESLTPCSGEVIICREFCLVECCGRPIYRRGKLRAFLGSLTFPAHNGLASPRVYLIPHLLVLVFGRRHAARRVAVVDVIMAFVEALLLPNSAEESSLHNTSRPPVLELGELDEDVALEVRDDVRPVRAEIVHAAAGVQVGVSTYLATSCAAGCRARSTCKPG